MAKVSLSEWECVGNDVFWGETVAGGLGECSRFVLIVEKCQEKGSEQMRVLGIDPGLRMMGWGVIEAEGSRITHIGNGVCRTEGTDLALRLMSLFDQLTDVVARFQPDTAAVEKTFVNKDGAGTLKLGQARGIAMLVPAQAGLEIGEYAPNSVKKTVVGVGHAGKQQIDHMVRLQLPGVEIAGPDAADALAIALCHAHHTRSSGRLAAALAKASGGAVVQARRATGERYKKGAA